MSQSLPVDYNERVYAGVLGKMIGVYLGRPIEGWSYDRITEKFGEITRYVHAEQGVPLVVSDDDLSGTFTFLRALPDYDNTLNLTPAQIGQTWLNYIIEKRTILWWGGLGNSTEHTAYLRLKHGISAPQSGSIALNSQLVAEQIGAQIFIDGWAMVAPGNPALAADLAQRAGSVSHDGEAVYAAQVLAAMEAQAFVEDDINTLLDTGVSFIPKDSIIYRLIADIRDWHATEPDWRETRKRIAQHYGYDTYGGNCHVIPNHALIILALLYGEGDFNRSLMIVNTCGWDTDCNSGNLGCLLGIRGGLTTLQGEIDWRGPIADRLYLPTADGGRTISDAVHETYEIVSIGRALAGLEPLSIKNGARFNFSLPGSVQGFQIVGTSNASLSNVADHSRLGTRSLAITFAQLSNEQPLHISTPTFLPPDSLHMGGYSLEASPTLYPGQTIHAGISTDPHNTEPVRVRLIAQYYGENDQLFSLTSTETLIAPGEEQVLTWQLPSTDGAPIATIGLELYSAQTNNGRLYLDYLTWHGEPNTHFNQPASTGQVWRRAWANAIDQYERWQPETYRLIQNEGRGLLIQGTRDWQNYQLTTSIKPYMAISGGIAARVQGLRRYYALLFTQQHTLQLLKVLDGEQILAEVPFSWEQNHPYTLSLQVNGTHLQGFVNEQLLIDVIDDIRPLLSGAIALVCEEGRTAYDSVSIQPLQS